MKSSSVLSYLFLPLFLGGFISVFAETSAIVGIAQAQGKRPTMEDAHCIEIHPDHAFFGLYDGHGGKQVADFAAERLHKIVMPLFQSYCQKIDCTQAIKAALHDGFLTINSDLDKAGFDVANQGSTAIVAAINANMLTVANIGDSRAILYSDNKVIALSEDHKPHRPDEKMRIQRLGGFVVTRGVPRVNGRLAISRAFGDKKLHPYVIAEPEIRQRNLTKDDDFLVIACDGVWDVIDSLTAAAIVKKSLAANRNMHAAAQTLKNEALHRGSTDNVSVLVIDMRQFLQP